MGKLDSTVQTDSALPGQSLHRRLGRVFLEVEGREDEPLTVTSTRVTGGRSGVNDLVLTDSSVSGVHFELRLSEEGVLLRDLGSTNGTSIRGVRVKEGWLEPGGSFSAGRCNIKLLATDEVDVPVSNDDHFGELVGPSSAMREVFATLTRIAPAEIDILLGGETGTGKELAARAIHDTSTRRDGPFVVLDCGSLPSELAEAMVLGHKKGAFTGALSDHPGCFEDASGGTLFLDEIGELPMALQPKLLRVLDRREVQRLGETRTREVDVRVVAATHRDLREMVASGRFREDLYFRIAEFVIDLPPLRERGDDVLVLAERFLNTFAPGRSLSLEETGRAALRAHGWPGNVRELLKTIKRAAILATGDSVGQEGLMLTARRDERDAHEAESLFEMPLKAATAAFEREYIRRMLRDTGGNQSEAARRSGYTRQGLRDAIKRLGL